MRRSRPGGAPSGLADHYDYLIAARQRVFDRVRALSQAQDTRKFPFGHGSIRATLVHIADTEWWFQGLDYSLMRWEWFKEHR